MTSKEYKITYIIHTIYVVLLVTLSIGFLICQVIHPSDRNPRDYYFTPLNHEWIHVDGDTRTEVELPTQQSAHPGEIVTFERKLPEHVSSNYWLCFRASRQDMTFYVDGVLRDSFSTKDTSPFGAASASIYIFVELKDTDSGKILTVETLSNSSYSGLLQSVLYGDKMAIILNLLMTNTAPLFLAGLILLLSSCSIILSLILNYIYKQKIALKYLGWCMFAVSLWIISQSKIRQIFIPNGSIAAAFSQYLLFLIPIPFAFYLNSLQEYRYKTQYFFYELFAFINFCICMFLTIADIRDTADMTGSIVILFTVLLVLVSYTIITDYRHGLTRKYSIVIYGIIAILFFGFIQIFQALAKSADETGLMLALGLTIFMLASGIQALKDVLTSENEKQQILYASEAKAKFLASMSHEIRTPINAILGIDEIIAKETGEAHIREYAEDIQNAGRNLLAIINDILDYSKIDSGKMTIIPMEYDLASVINDSCNMIRVRAEKKGLLLKVECDPNLPCRLYGDEIRIRQIMINLLTNAIKYTHEGIVKLKIYSPRTDSSDMVLGFSVTDTGIGIKPEVIPILFDSFQRVDDDNTHQIEGSGLGLSIVQELVELMNGSVSVESVYGKGSTFTVTLPQKIISPSPIGDLSTALSHGTYSLIDDNFMAPGARVLIVDDVPVNLKVFCGLLKDTMIDIDTASSGRECITKVQNNSYDLIFLDHMMPDLNGVDTLSGIHKLENHKKCPVIMLTANAVLGAKEDYLQMGFHDYLSKPIQKDKLIYLLKKYLPKELILSKEAAITSANTGNIEDITFLNTKQGLTYHSQDAEFYMEILHAYHEDDRSAAIQNHFDNRNWKDYQIMVHALSSSSRLIGADTIASNAKELELAVKREDYDYIYEHHQETIHSYQELITKLDKFFSPIINLKTSVPNAFRILVVDDDKLNLMTAYKILEPYFTLTCLEKGKDALEYVHSHYVDLILLDIHMPDMDGFHVIQQLKGMENTKNIPVIFLTSDSDTETELAGFKAGAMDFIHKPFIPDIMLERINRVLELDKLQRYLQSEVERNTSKMEKLSLQTMMTLAKTIDAKDAYTKGHSSRVAIYAKKIARKMGLSAAEQDTIYFTGLLHDIGKIGIPDNIINKPGRLNDQEFALVKRHPEIGYDILKNIAEIPNIEAGARWHHERLDGKGYPDGLKGNEIPKFVRIISVADSYDAMSSIRSYRDMLPQDYIIKELEKGKGTQFDPDAADAMIQLIKEDVNYMMKGV